MRIIEWIGGNAPDRQATLKVDDSGALFAHLRYRAIWEPGYCGCRDCYPIVGYGPTPEAAIADYWEQWEDEQDTPSETLE